MRSEGFFLLMRWDGTSHCANTLSHFHNQLFLICSQNEKINMWESDTQTNSNDDQGLTENSVTEQEVLKCIHLLIQYQYRTYLHRPMQVAS